MKTYVLTVILAAASLILAMPTPTMADVLINGGFDIAGPNSVVVVHAIDTKMSAAFGWDEWAGVGSISTDLLPTTDPLGHGLMIHVITDNGYYTGGSYGNGIGQPFNPDPLVDGGVYPLGGTLNFDIFVVSGQVTAGLVRTSDGNFAAGTGVFNPGTWVHFTQTVGGDLRDVRFEILTLGAGAEFYADNATFDPVVPVSRKDAVVTPDAANPHAVKVNSPGGTAGPITVRASIVEKPGYVTLGNISLAVPVTCTLNPILPGTSYTVMASTSGGGIGGTLNATCVFPVVQVNAYELVFSIGGNFYTGSAEATLAVYDPSFGFVTGGGTIVNPNNGFTGEFGFNAKYLPNGKPHAAFLYIEHQPTGDVVLQGVAAQSLSIIGTSAVIITKGVLNGKGNYLIYTSVTDNREPGVNNDLFGIEVQNSDTTDVNDLTFPRQVITGGNIQIPHKTP